MTAHYRKQLRDKAKTILTGLPTTRSNVFSGRVSPLTAGDLPGLVVVTGNENAAFGAMGSNAATDRMLDLVIVAEAVGNDDMYDTLDLIAAEVETALFADGDADLEGLALAVHPPRSRLEITGEDASRVGRLSMIFPVEYRTARGDPTTGA